jgi:leader peptidase (prepilin peptidase)/N-methyltransferase
MRTRPLICAAIGATAFAAIAALGEASALTFARLTVLGAALAAAAMHDLAERRIPNRLVLTASALCAVLALTGGQSPAALFAGLTLVCVLLISSLLWPHALGMGDVKLSLLLVLGFDGDAIRAVALGFGLAALAGLALLARRRRDVWRASLPLAPFLAAGALIAILSWAAG